MAEHNSNDHLATPLVTSPLEGIAPNQTTSGLANVEPAQNMPQQTLVTTEPSSVSTSTRELIEGLSKPSKSPTSIHGFLNRFLAGRQEHGEANHDNNPPAPESNSDNSNNSPSGNS